MDYMDQPSLGIKADERRQLTLDILATGLAYWRVRADRVQHYLEVSGVSEETLNATTEEGRAIFQFLAAIGRAR
jgi:hypothetical protein